VEQQIAYSEVGRGLLQPIPVPCSPGRDLAHMTEKELLEFPRQIGFVFQEGALFDSLSVADNVLSVARRSYDEDEVEQRVRNPALGKWKRPSTNSFRAFRRMRRRVSIARALVARPPVVLYDSPTAGLDPVTAQTIITLILRLRDTQGVTSLLATHRLQMRSGLQITSSIASPAASCRYAGRTARRRRAANEFTCFARRESLFRRQPSNDRGIQGRIFAPIFVVGKIMSSTVFRRNHMAQHKQLTWTELRVGLFVLAALASWWL